MMKKKKSSSSMMNRSQSRLMEKQLKAFSIKFNNFTVYQLRVIRNLIDDIIERKCSDER